MHSKESDRIVILDVTRIYAEQPFMQGLCGNETSIYIDCANIPGTDCYCDDEAAATLRKQIDDAGIKNAEGIHFFDNGNYHYMSKIWTDMVQEPFTLVVFDHHPDMQPPRFGDILSCGGWVKKVLDENKFIDNVVIIGVADHLVDEIREEIASHPSGARNDNVFFIRGREVWTAPSDRVLLGVTRSKVIDVIREAGLDLHFKSVREDHLASFDAAFISGTSTPSLSASSIQKVMVYPTSSL